MDVNTLGENISKSLLGVSLRTDITFRILFWIVFFISAEFGDFFFLYYCLIFLHLLLLFWGDDNLLLPLRYLREGRRWIWASFSPHMRRMFHPLSPPPWQQLSLITHLSWGWSRPLEGLFYMKSELNFSFCPLSLGWWRKMTVGIMREVSSLLCSWKKTT